MTKPLLPEADLTGSWKASIVTNVPCESLAQGPGIVRNDRGAHGSVYTVGEPRVATISKAER